MSIHVKHQQHIEPHLDGDRIKFILSAGRTGTVFLSKMLAEMCPRHEVIHEPPTSRRVFMLWNAEAAGWAPAGTARRIFIKNRRKILSGFKDGRCRLEINTFLQPLAPELNQIVKPLHIIHLVRDARDWIQSMANFGAAGVQKHFIDYVPFGRTIHPDVRRNWHKLDTISQFAWRWRLANEQLLASAENAEHYCLIRYEDLFSSDRLYAREAVRQLLTILPPGCGEMPIDASWGKRVNPGRTGKIDAWHQWPQETRDGVMDICGPLLKIFGYSEDR